MTLSFSRHPLPSDPAAVPAWERRVARMTKVDLDIPEIQSAMVRPRADRVAVLFALGAWAGMRSVLHGAWCRGADVPTDPSQALALLESRARGISAPPAAAFSQSIVRSAPVIYRAGVEATT